MPIEAIVLPTWQVEMYSLMCSSWRSASFAPRSALLARQLEARVPRAHQRVLGDHEERVERDQHRRQAATQSQFTAAPQRCYFEEVRRSYGRR